MRKSNLFIAVYGINNIGKSTQTKMLGEKLSLMGLNTKVIKYPIYDIPSGIRINDYLRNKNPEKLTPQEAQVLYARNRRDFQEKLLDLLERNIVIAEDYTGTGIAWGVGAGVDKDLLLNVNSDLLKEDFAILMDGNRFSSGIETGHKHENDNPLIKRVREVHLELGKDYGWRTVNANQDPEKVHEDIWSIVSEFI